MAGIRQIAVALGLGNARLEVSVPSGPIARGSGIDGEIALIGGMAPQEVQALEVSLVGYRSRGKSTQAELYEGLVLADRLSIHPHARQSFPFRIRIPDNAVRSAGGAWTDSTVVQAVARIDWAVDPRAKARLHVTDHREIRALQAAMRYLGFSECGAGFTLTVKEPSPELVTTHFRPPARLTDQLDQAVLGVEVHEGQVTGTLDLNFHETNLRDRVKALLVTQYQTHALDFAPNELLTPEGGPNVYAARMRIEGILEEALLLPNNEKNTLLRAADAPDAELLLRPAASGTQARPEELLRPVDPEEEPKSLA